MSKYDQKKQRKSLILLKEKTEMVQKDQANILRRL